VGLPGWDNPDLELDRKDNEKGYKPENLQFSTHAQNCQNRRTVQRLQAENDDLRHRLQRAEEQIRRLNAARADRSP